MIYDIAYEYGLNPKEVEREWDVYDYYEQMVFKVQRMRVKDYLNGMRRS